MKIQYSVCETQIGDDIKRLEVTKPSIKDTLFPPKSTNKLRNSNNTFETVKSIQNFNPSNFYINLLSKQFQNSWGDEKYREGWICVNEKDCEKGVNYKEEFDVEYIKKLPLTKETINNIPSCSNCEQPMKLYWSPERVTEYIKKGLSNSIVTWGLLPRISKGSLLIYTNKNKETLEEEIVGWSAAYPTSLNKLMSSKGNTEDRRFASSQKMLFNPKNPVLSKLFSQKVLFVDTIGIGQDLQDQLGFEDHTEKYSSLDRSERKKVRKAAIELVNFCFTDALNLIDERKGTSLPMVTRVLEEEDKTKNFLRFFSTCGKIFSENENSEKKLEIEGNPIRSKIYPNISNNLAFYEKLLKSRSNIYDYEDYLNKKTELEAKLNQNQNLSDLGAEFLHLSLDQIKDKVSYYKELLKFVESNEGKKVADKARFEFIISSVGFQLLSPTVFIPATFYVYPNHLEYAPLLTGLQAYSGIIGPGGIAGINRGIYRFFRKVLPSTLSSRHKIETFTKEIQKLPMQIADGGYIAVAIDEMNVSSEKHPNGIFEGWKEDTKSIGILSNLKWKLFQTYNLLDKFRKYSGI